MREIKCRGKRLDNGKWVEGYYVCIGEEYPYIYTGKLEINEDDVWTEKYPVISETVGQYTGMKDYSGTEIYEGDIVKIDDELVWGSMTSCGMEYDSVSVETHALIGWIDEDCAFGITRTNLGDGECDSQFLFDISPDGNEEKLAEKIRHTEVVGNIHDNPELMEEEHK